MIKRLTYALLIASSLPLVAQIRLNEFMASNTRAYPDITDFEDYPDWIELHNTSNQPLSLDGYYLSDDAENPQKWAFDIEATIEASEYLVVIADGRDTALGRAFRRSSHQRPRFVTEKHHTNFSLSSSGEYLSLSKVEKTPITFLPVASTWRYLDDGSNQGTAWREPDFNDSSWASGAAPLGYGDPSTTVISFGDTNNRHITSYFRTTFEVDDPSNLGDLFANLKVDDGAVVYLNGQQIVFENIRNDEELNYLTRAEDPITQDLEEIINSYRFPASLIQVGTNTLAVEVHQISPTSIDMRFDLSITGKRFSVPTVIDATSFTQQVSDVSRGRDPQNPNRWVQFAESTAGAANGGALVTDLREDSDEVEISPTGGFISPNTLIELSCSEGDIFYTLDGSNPSTQSLRYISPFRVNETTVVRARCFASGKVPGQIATQTYFIGSNPGGLPILSVVADPETLFGDRIGIYFNQHEETVGIGPSVYKGKDAPGHLEFFPNDGTQGFGVNGGIRIGGENNWASHAQRALNFATRGRYGDDSIDYDLFPGSGIPSFTALTIREGGDDWGQAHLTDALFDSIARGRMEVETNRSRPASVYINGEYWGLYNIRDRWDDNWFFQSYGTNDGDYDRINTGQGETAENGSDEDWRDLINFLSNNDLTDPVNWAVVEKRIDLVSAADFVIAESYGRNSSWGRNREIWRDARPGGKWRFFIPDMDRTFGNSGTREVMGAILSRDQIISRIVQNAEFRRLIAQRMAAHQASTFEPDRVVGLINSISERVANELPRQRAAWTAPEAENYQASLSRMRSFALSAVNLDETQFELGLSDPVQLTLLTNGEGSFEIEGIPVDASSLEVFPNIPLKITAIPAPGFRFDGWNGLQDGADLEVTLTQARTLTASFVSSTGQSFGGTLTSNRTLTTSGSPYLIEDDLIIPSGRTLTINPGVELFVSPGRHIRVQGRLNIQGTAAAPVNITGDRGQDWGGISFENTTNRSTLSHFKIRNATRGKDPVNFPAAIAGLNADLTIEFLDISSERDPLFFRGGSLILRDSLIDIPVTGDGINVKQGEAETLRCTFIGNNSPDTDAIDYDGVIGGLIEDCRIYRFFGFNSDGIDTGEQCQNVVIRGNRIFFNSDKGISVGQASSVIAEDNLIVGCSQGIGVKDQGSTVVCDSNTFVDCRQGVTVFEKNFGSGGGQAFVTNSIFSQCKFPVDSDTFSNVSISYSLSDTTPLIGPNNLASNAGFTNSDILDFSLRADSPARDTGNPNRGNDEDGSLPDRGARYQYNPEDYPFLLNNSIVINEVLANSGLAPDWLELHNRSDEDTNIGGWFLSDDGSDLAKYRIAPGTIIPAGGYLILTENDNFGNASSDSGKITGFSLSDTGETVHLSSATGDTLTDYRFRENFGASFEGQTLGFYFKESTDSYNFVAQETATPGAANETPAVGPLVISEIMYDPAANLDSEYLEILNISTETVSLFDAERFASWRMGDGIDLIFPSTTTLAPGERLLLVNNLAGLAEYNIPADTQVIQWTSGRLNDGGETVQLERPGPLRTDGSRSYVRVDRVKYDDDAPWPTAARGTGQTLQRLFVNEYGNDVANWATRDPRAGRNTPLDTFESWAGGLGLSSPSGDPDGDGLSNLLEYALGSNPRVSEAMTLFNFDQTTNTFNFGLNLDPSRPDVRLMIEESPDLTNWSEMELENFGFAEGRFQKRLSLPRNEQKDFFRLNAERIGQ